MLRTFQQLWRNRRSKEIQNNLIKERIQVINLENSVWCDAGGIEKRGKSKRR